MFILLVATKTLLFVNNSTIFFLFVIYSIKIVLKMSTQKNKNISRTISRNISRTISRTKTKKKQIKSKAKSKSKSKSNISNISILSYNVSWESLSGEVKNWSLCNNNTDKTNPKHYSVCVNNISSVFDNSSNSSNTLDFITLQEATDFQKLIKESSRLKKMKYEVHKSGLDTIVTFWDSKYKMKNKFVGEFDKGRPWMSTLFSNGICLINIHMGHYDKEEEFNKLEKMYLDIKTNIEKIKNIKNKKQIKNLRYIISGDFNYDIKEFGESRNYFILDNTKFYFNPKHILTCLINRRRHNDHVIDSLESPIDINIPEVNYMASDHKPILVEVKIVK